MGVIWCLQGLVKGEGRSKLHSVVEIEGVMKRTLGVEAQGVRAGEGNRLYKAIKVLITIFVLHTSLQILERGESCFHGNT